MQVLVLEVDKLSYKNEEHTHFSSSVQCSLPVVMGARMGACIRKQVTDDEVSLTQQLSINLYTLITGPGREESISTVCKQSPSSSSPCTRIG